MKNTLEDSLPVRLRKTKPKRPCSCVNRGTAPVLRHRICRLHVNFHRNVCVVPPDICPAFTTLSTAGVFRASLQPDRRKHNTLSYPEEGQVTVLLHVRDLQVLQHHGAVAVGLHHVQVVVLSGAEKVQTVGDALAYCKRKRKI